MNQDNEQLKKTEKALSHLNKVFGDKVFKGSEPTLFTQEIIGMDSLALGDAVNYWGFPKGKISQLYGPEGSGKTFFAMLAVREALRANPGSSVLWLDCEYSFSMDWAESLGIDVSRILHVEENIAAEVFAIMCGEVKKEGVLDLVAKGELDISLIVLDSIASLLPPVEEGRSFKDQNIAALARFLPGAFRVATSKLAKTNVPMICINQAREAIGTFLGGLTYPGGRTYRHMCSLNILFNTSLAKDATLFNHKGDKIGHMVKCTVEKTRGGVNRSKVDVWLDFTRGVVKLGEEVALLGVGYGIIQRPNKAKWIYGEYEVIGKDNFFSFLDENEEIRNKIIEEVREVKKNGIKIVEQKEDSEQELEKAQE